MFWWSCCRYYEIFWKKYLPSGNTVEWWPLERMSTGTLAGTTSKNSQALREALSFSTASQSSHSAANSTTLSGNRRRYTTTSTSTSTESILTSTEFTELNEEAEGNQQGETKQDMPPPSSAIVPDTVESNVVNLILQKLAIETSVGIFIMWLLWCVCFEHKRKINQLCDHTVWKKWNILFYGSIDWSGRWSDQSWWKCDRSPG